MQEEHVKDNIILKIRSGSHLYGTATETSDKDFVGIFIPPMESLHGLTKVDEIDCSKHDKDAAGRNTVNAEDYKLYSLQKFLRLAVANNPNIIEILFVNEENILTINDFGRNLLNNKMIFPCIEARDRFCGYASNQRHKMIIKTDKFNVLKLASDYFHNLIDKNPDAARTYLVEFRDKHLPFLEWTGEFCKIGDLNIQLNYQLRKAIKSIDQRMAKVTSRKELILKHGYDTKFGSHLIRLLLEGKRLLETGGLIFPLPERDIILSIKGGTWSINKLLDYAEELQQEINDILPRSCLHKKRQFKAVDLLCQTIINEFVRKHI